LSPRAGPDGFGDEKKIPCSCWNSNPGLPSPYPSRYTKYFIKWRIFEQLLGNERHRNETRMEKTSYSTRRLVGKLGGKRHVKDWVGERKENTKKKVLRVRGR